MGGVFHAYDVRGVWGTEIDAGLCERIGRAVARHLGCRRACVSRDMRESAVPAAAALVRGLTAMGCDVEDAGLCSTPMHYFACGSGGFDSRGSCSDSNGCGNC